MRRSVLLGWTLAVAAGAAAAFVSEGQADGQGMAGAAIELRVSKRGFEPSRVTVRKGETARLVLSSSDGEHCFAIDALRVEKRIVPGRSTRLELTPARAGTFAFYCCLESGEAAEVQRGELVVAE
jgi:heme/copper-type cytochrome/quinol oxidase subunit 2